MQLIGSIREPSITGGSFTQGEGGGEGHPLPEQGGGCPTIPTLPVASKYNFPRRQVTTSKGFIEVFGRHIRFCREIESSRRVFDNALQKSPVIL